MPRLIHHHHRFGDLLDDGFELLGVELRGEGHLLRLVALATLLGAVVEDEQHLRAGFARLPQRHKIIVPVCRTVCARNAVQFDR
jgi:hypothetical protein